MTRVLMKGNEAVGAAAIAAGCHYFFGYPITPQNEIPEYMSRELPKIGGTYVQAESELAAINMVYGAAGSGARVMTSSSSPGIALKQEGISYCAGAELPCVIVNMMRGGPGLGSIQPAQGDYFLSTRGGGNGDYRLLVLAPADVQELVDLVMEGFDLADIYRIPVLILGDGMIGQIMEPVEFRYKPRTDLPEKDWATRGTGKGKQKNIINSLYLEAEKLEAHNHKLQAKYAKMRENEKRVEEYNIEGADIVLTAYGTTSRIAKAAISKLEKEGYKVGLIRPISLYPFPNESYEKVSENCKGVLSIEMSAGGQMIDDVKLSLNGRIPAYFYGRSGGMVPEPDEIVEEVKSILGGGK